MKVHFIAIGGSAMHNLAIALHKKGYKVTGSDDEIFEPSNSRLKKYGLLPDKIGWNASLITSDIDAIILGMHAKEDNPELIKATKLGIKIFSYPEFLYEQSKNKKRVVIGGSHGKTTITSMVLHVLQDCGIDHDYMVGAQLEGFEVMVKISEEANIMVLEGDEYLTSPIDRRPKFHLYHPDIALISGIAWDHINVFPTFDNYIEQFEIFAQLISKNGTLIYCQEDNKVKQIGMNVRSDIKSVGYGIPKYNTTNGLTEIIYANTHYPIQVFGEHNLMNLNGARLICNELGISDQKFYTSIAGFKGASKRLEIVGENKHSIIFKDFAHAPSKLKATTKAVKQQFPKRKLIACLELHTYSSLNKKFLPQYKDSMNDADLAIVYFNDHTLKLKKLPDISTRAILDAFNRPDLKVIKDSNELWNLLIDQKTKNLNYLMMSSGNFDGLDFDAFKNIIL